MDNRVYLWKVGIGEPDLKQITVEWHYVMAPDVATAARVVEEWFVESGFQHDSPLEIILEVHFVDGNIMGSGDLVRFEQTLEWASTNDAA